MLGLVSCALAAEPLLHEDVVPWTVARLRAAGLESPALGPDLFARGPDGELAWYDPVERAVVLDGVEIPTSPVEDLAFAADGRLLVLQDRVLAVVHGDRRTLPDIVPPGGRLELRGALVCSTDLFANCHPVATLTATGLAAPTGPALLPPVHRVERRGTELHVDGALAWRGEGRVAGRVEGGWLLVEDRRDDRLVRGALRLADGAWVDLPSAARAYVPGRDVAVSPDGALTVFDPRADGLHVVEAR